ncbi:hypothetical protein ACFV80_42480 [Streptomyces sp. NPDC059862]|uniref:hypothetical protein n=1 Tax=Streptomyces sp. NPDC059862 TaxID=3346975 RepID=UPI00366A3D5B
MESSIPRNRSLGRGELVVLLVLEEIHVEFGDKDDMKNMDVGGNIGRLPRGSSLSRFRTRSSANLNSQVSAAGSQVWGATWVVLGPGESCANGIQEAAHGHAGQRRFFGASRS